MEEALYEIGSMRAFAKLSLERHIPDETTILNFRRRIEDNDLAEDILALVNGHLTRQGLLLKRGTIVDATIIPAPSSTKNSQGNRDPEMHQTKKGEQWYFGMKAHIGVDVDSGLVHTVTTTAANEADVEQVSDLLHGKEVVVHGDAGYTGVENRVERKVLTREIAMKRGKLKAMPEGAAKRTLEQAEKRKASIRARVSGEGPLPRPGEEHLALDDVVCLVESVDGATTIDGAIRTVASAAGVKAIKQLCLPRNAIASSDLVDSTASPNHYDPPALKMASFELPARLIQTFPNYQRQSAPTAVLVLNASRLTKSMSEIGKKRARFYPTNP